MSSPHRKNVFLAQVVKLMQKKISKFSSLFRFGLFSLLFAKYFVQDGMVDGIDLDGIVTHSLTQT